MTQRKPRRQVYVVTVKKTRELVVVYGTRKGADTFVEKAKMRGYHEYEVVVEYVMKEKDNV